MFFLKAVVGKWGILNRVKMADINLNERKKKKEIPWISKSLMIIP
jgi:hypothetical protein